MQLSVGLSNIYIDSRSFSFNLNQFWTLLSATYKNSDLKLNLKVYKDQLEVCSYSQSYLSKSIYYFTYLGRSAKDYYEGFLYSFKVLSLALDDFSSEYLNNICGNSQGPSCLLECNFYQYFDNSCKKCSSSCTGECFDERSDCTNCSNAYCKTCSSSSTCTLCHDESTSGDCVCNGYINSSRDCIACYETCSKCTKNSKKCDSCKSDYFKLDYLCISECPTGYQVYENECYLAHSLSYELNLTRTKNLGILNEFTIGSSDSNTYPNFDENDPFPFAYRGYYFENNKYISKNFTFPPKFAFSLWINIVDSGVILQKQGLILLTADSVSKISMQFTLADNSTLTLSRSVSDWSFVTFVLSYGNYAISNLKAYLNKDSVVSSSQKMFFTDRLDDLLFIGSTDGGFKGLLAAFTIDLDITHVFNGYEMVCFDLSNEYCLSNCSYDEYYFLSACLEDCPSGFNKDYDHSCEADDLRILDVELNDTLALGEINGLIIGSNSTNSYPTYDENDPWPSYKRGFYFNLSAYMRKSLRLSPDFILTLWYLRKTDGTLLNKTSDKSSL